MLDHISRLKPHWAYLSPVPVWFHLLNYLETTCVDKMFLPPFNTRKTVRPKDVVTF